LLDVNFGIFSHRAPSVKTAFAVFDHRCLVGAA
jgi:hypothetical protein